MPESIIDVDLASFSAEVVDRSHQIPVVVDFWAAWCGPCRTLGPMIEAAVKARYGAVILAKVDVDRNQPLAQQFGVQGIPAVHAFRDGKVVDRFTGAVPQAQIEAFLDRLVPSAADRAIALAATQDPQDARRTLEAAHAADPAEGRVAIALAELLVAEDPARASTLVNAHPATPGADRVGAALALAAASSQDPDDLLARAARGDAGASMDLARVLVARGDVDAALERVLADLERTTSSDPAREVLRTGILEILTLLEGDPRVGPARARLARALF